MKRIRIKSLIKYVVPLVLWFLSFDFSEAQINYPFQDVSYNVNGRVQAVAVDEINNITYIGGTFTRVNIAVRGTVLDATTGLNPKDYPDPNGTVLAAVSDDAGGFFIAGQFTRVGGIDRPYIAHINAAGEVSDWNPQANATVFSLALKDDILYAGGDFTTIGGQARNYIAAIDMSGVATSWDPSANNDVRAIALDNNSLYVGGSFSEIGGEARGRVAELDLNGDATSWNPGANSIVFSLVVDDDVVYAAGFFTTIGGQSRNSLAAIDKNGLVTSWDPQADARVVSLSLSEDILYVGGQFDNIGGESRGKIAAFDANGDLTGWSPTANNSVSSINAMGGLIYVGGNFGTIGGEMRRGLAALSPTGTGSATSWDPGAASVQTIAGGNGEIYVGGNLFAGVARSNLASFDASGNVTDWNPTPSGMVNSIEVDENNVYVGGSFITIAGEDRFCLAAFDLNGDLTSWDPDPNNEVRDIELDGNTVYLGGRFTTVKGTGRSRIAAVDAVTGIPIDWDPSTTGTAVNAIAIADNIVYAGGDFTAMGGETRNGIASIDAMGNVTAWDPVAANGSIFNALAVADGIVYAGGNFSTVNSLTRNNLVALNTTTAAVTSWDPSPNGEVNALAINAGTIYAGGGAFTSIGGETRNYIAAIDAAGSVENWDLKLSSIFLPTLMTIKISQGTVLFGGTFSNVGRDALSNVASVFAWDEIAPSFTSGTSVNIAENTSGTIYTAMTDENVTFSFGTSKDESLFTLSGNAIAFIAAPDFENPSDENTNNEYLIDITATDIAGNATTQEVTIIVTDADEDAPVFTSSNSITVDENIPTSQVIYTASASDSGIITYTLGGTDAASFTLAASSGELTFVASPDFETRSSYTIAITATDDAGNSAELSLTVAINDLKDDEILGLFETVKFLVYPNPVTDQIIMEGMALNSYQQLIVSTMQGKQVLSFNDLSTTYFDVSKLSPGMYVLLLKSESRIVNAGRMIKR
ncbi:MAG: T9SS type A sorting domain-containing protein [Bacteroidota bacterium]